MDSINEITAKTEVPLEPSPEVKAKGQLISEGLFGVLNFSKNQ